MSEFFSLLRIAAISGVLLGWYSLFLRNRRMHGYNRFYLLAAVVISVAVPAIVIPVTYSAGRAYATVSRAIAIINSPGDEIVNAGTPAHMLPWADILIAGYAAIVLLLLLRTAVQVFRLHIIRRRGHCYTVEGITIVPTDLPSAPFSFLRYIYWNRDTDINSIPGQRILRHELAHIRQRHTWDKLFLQLVCAIYWPVPFFWLMKKELSLVHEFLADETAIDNNDTAALAEMLLHTTIGQTSSITNTFYSSPIKRRILMLTNNSRDRYSTVRMLSVLPVIAGALLLTSFRFTPAPIKTNHKVTIVVDAGHGGQDAGAIHNAVREKDLNMKIVNKLADLAGEYDIDVIKTRSGDDYPTLTHRAEISNATTADAFISIHVNKEDHKIIGDYVVYVSQAGKQYTQSVKLASAIAASMAVYNPQVVNKGLVVLKANEHPAVLIECGNIEKDEQVALLLNDSKLDELCRRILSGIVAFKNNPDAGRSPQLFDR